MTAAEDVPALREALRVAREELQLHENFLAIVTHELRNPVGPVLMSIDALQIEAAHGIDKDTLIRRLSMMRRYVDRLRGDLDRLLDFSRLRGGKVDLQREDVDLSTLVRENVRQLDGVLGASGCEVVTTLESPLVGHWDAMRLNQVVWNLLTNAAKYCAGEPIEMTTRSDAHTAIFTIRDHGPGIPEDQHEAVFKKFERADAELHTGFGIGLWLVRRIVEAMNGTIALVSKVGVGTTFTVTLPRNA